MKLALKGKKPNERIKFPNNKVSNPLTKKAKDIVEKFEVEMERGQDVLQIAVNQQDKWRGWGSKKHKERKKKKTFFAT